MLGALGVPTSRSFSVIETGEALMRHDEPSPTRSAVLVRLSHSHIRLGTFQRAAFRGDKDGLAKLVTYVAENLLPGESIEEAHDLLEVTARRVAKATARIMAAGFVHGVLNTDNINVTGEVFDFGPWRFLPELDPAFTAAYFDHGGLYAFGRQPEAVHWNLAAFADALMPIADQKKLYAVLEAFPDIYAAAFGDAVLRRLGLEAGSSEEDTELASDVFSFLARTKLPFEETMFGLHAAHLDGWTGGEKAPQDKDSQALYERLKARPPEPDAPGPYGHAPESLLIDEVERLWRSIDEEDDWGPLNEKIARIRRYRDWAGLSASL
jgi:uncharacterized protein YdiU (UPF0061 family)